MDRILYAAIALGGLAVVVANRQFAASSQASSAKYFGRPIRPGSREDRFMTAFSRITSVVAGLGLFVMGTLGALGVIWTS